MKLLGSNGSPFVRKVRVVMAEKKIDFQYEIVDVMGQHAQVQQVNPLGKIPCLVMDDGGALFDSRVIVEYLDNLTPVHKLIPAGGRERAEVKTWEALADGLLDAAVQLRVEHTQRTESQRSPHWIARQTSKLESALAAIARGLGDNAYCVDGKYSLADVAVGCALPYISLRFPEIGWRSQYPNLARHIEKLNTRQSFIDTAPPQS